MTVTGFIKFNLFTDSMRHLQETQFTVGKDIKIKQEILLSGKLIKRDISCFPKVYKKKKIWLNYFYRHLLN